MGTESRDVDMKVPPFLRQDFPEFFKSPAEEIAVGTALSAGEDQGFWSVKLDHGSDADRIVRGGGVQNRGGIGVSVCRRAVQCGGGVELRTFRQTLFRNAGEVVRAGKRFQAAPEPAGADMIVAGDQDVSDG